MGLKAAVQALKKAEPLKDKVQNCKDLLNDNDAWICQQQLQKIYQQVLILDLEYALDKKVEQELWNLGFKNYIATLQSQAKDKKNPKRCESQALLSWCLEAASGFYLTLLQEICTAFDLDLPFRRKGYAYGCNSSWKAVKKLSTPHKSSCFYACQYCLVHLGDIARYRNESRQAELFYRHAVSLSPSSGQPYNQLALLEASRGDKLATVFHYARSVTVKHPFPVAAANLAKTLSSVLNDHSFTIEGKTKLNSQEYITVFLKFHSILHNFGDLKIASSYVKLLTETLTALVATESFTSWKLVQMFVINLYALQHAAASTLDSTDIMKPEQLSTDEKASRDCVLDLIGGCLSALLLPVYTIKNSIIDYFALPSVKLCLDWIYIEPTILEENAFTSRLQIWPSLCVLLNALQDCVINFKHEQYAKIPLPEDRDLQGFLPLEKSFDHLRFNNTNLEIDLPTTNKLRAVRILQLGRNLVQHQVNGSAIIPVKMKETKEHKFVFTSEGDGPSNELMKELEELSLNKEQEVMVPPSPVPSESASSKESIEADLLENVLEKRIGILKPQGTLERTRDSITNGTEHNAIEINAFPLARKPRQNIAMQAIMRRAESEQKQVTFKNISPVITEEENEKKMISLLATNNMENETNKPSINPEISTSNGVQPDQNVQNQLISPIPTVESHAAQSLPNSSKSIKPPCNNSPQLSSGNQILSVETPQVSRAPRFGQQIGIIQPLCYPNQSFNVRNPQFSKNFMTNQMTDVSQYQMKSQLNNPGSPNISQNITMQQQNRTLHQQRGVTQNPLLPPNIESPSIAHQITNMILQQQNPNTQQQQNHNLSVQQSNIIQPNIRSNPLTSHGQIGMNDQHLTNNLSSPIPTYTGYLNNLQQMTSMTNLPNNTLNLTTTTNTQMNLNQIFGQNNFNHVAEKQSSPIYNKTLGNNLEFPFLHQTNSCKNQPQSTNGYQMFENHEVGDFGLWKEAPLPQPPITWWGTATGSSNGSGGGGSGVNSGVGGGTPQLHCKETPPASTFHNWQNLPNSANLVGRIPPPTENNYHSQLQDRNFNVRNNFDDTRMFEVDQKSTQLTNTGNTYSLFSGNTWNSQASNISSQDKMKTRLNQQSLWSGPGPSPLERLLEQQKSLREGGT